MKIRSTFLGLISKNNICEYVDRLDMQESATLYTCTEQATYYIYMDFSSLADGDSITVTLELFLNNSWKIFSKTVISNYQTESVFSQAFDSIPGIRITAKQTLGNPREVFTRVSRK
jgi:hypothetical protein